jgi:hypothetical protein
MKLNPINWCDIKNEVFNVNPDIYNVLEDIIMQSEELYIAEYYFGENIISDGVFQGVSDINDLNYDVVPIGVILDKELECYLHRNKENITVNYFKPGSLIGVFPYIYNLIGEDKRYSKWNLDSGSRSLLSAQQLLNKRKQQAVFAYLQCPPSDFNERGYPEYQLFTDICIKEQVKWKSKILLIPRKIYNQLNTPKFQPLSHVILKSGLILSHKFTHRQFNNFHLWSEILEVLRLRGYKCDLYTSQVLYQIFSICVSNLVGYRVIKDESSCPLSHIEDVFNNIYKTTAPFKLLRVELARNNIEEPIYISLQNLVISLGNNNVPNMSPTLYKALEQIAYMVNMLFPKVESVANYVDKIKFISTYAEDGNKMIANYSDAYVFLKKENLNKYSFFKNCIEIDLS